MCRIAFLSLILFLLSACGASGSTQQTLEAHDGTMQARLDNLYLTGTVQADRLLVTLEFIQTRIVQATQQQREIISTLQAMEIDVSVLPQAATPMPTRENASEGSGVIAPIVTPGGLITPSSSAPAVVTSSNAFISDLVMSTDVGDDDCATGVTNQFNSSAESIYIVGVARGIPDGTTMSTRWLNASGEELANYSHTFDTISEEACVWFFVDQTDFPFTAGTYSVSFAVDDTVAATVPFTITE